MIRSGRTLLFAISACLSAAAGPVARAQAPVAREPGALRGLDDLTLGVKLRVVTLTSPPERIQGRFAGLHGSLLSVAVGQAPPREVSIGQLLRVDEAYRDRVRGALLGLIPGIVGVYAWDYLGSHARYPDQHKRYQENRTALAITCGTGALLGAVIGWQRWRLVQTSTR